MARGQSESNQGGGVLGCRGDEWSEAIVALGQAARRPSCSAAEWRALSFVRERLGQRHDARMLSLGLAAAEFWAEPHHDAVGPLRDQVEELVGRRPSVPLVLLAREKAKLLGLNPDGDGLYSGWAIFVAGDPTLPGRARDAAVHELIHATQPALAELAIRGLPRYSEDVLEGITTALHERLAGSGEGRDNGRGGEQIFIETLAEAAACGRQDDYLVRWSNQVRPSEGIAADLGLVSGEVEGAAALSRGKSEDEGRRLAEGLLRRDAS